MSAFVLFSLILFGNIVNDYLNLSRSGAQTLIFFGRPTLKTSGITHSTAFRAGC